MDGKKKVELLKMIESARPVLDATNDAMTITDINGSILYKNEAYRRMMKRGSTEFVSDRRDIRDCKTLSGNSTASNRGESIGNVTIYHDVSEVNRLKRELDRVNQKLRKAEVKYTFKDIIGKNPELLKVIETAKVAAMTPATILIRGESGTGKEIMANAIHNTSKRRNEKFVKINCSSIPEELLESELFGYKEGAFTGARRGGKKGLFQEADGGTLFLDEIGDVSPKMQVKLLRSLQEREIMPVGSTETIPVDVRVISATNKNLEEMVEDGEFREDLYYRLNVFPLYIPPLRKRKEDMEAIVLYLLNKYDSFYDRQVTSVDQQSVEWLQKKDWPGNIRELENVISRALINLDVQAQNLSVEDIAEALGGKEIRRKQTNADSEENEMNLELLPQNLSDALKIVERQLIEKTLTKADGDKNRAAAELQVPLRTLYYKCKTLGIK